MLFCVLLLAATVAVTVSAGVLATPITASYGFPYWSAVPAYSSPYYAYSSLYPYYPRYTYPYSYTYSYPYAGYTYGYSYLYK